MIATMGTERARKSFVTFFAMKKKTTKDWDGVFVLYKWFNTANTYLKTLTPRGIGGIVFFLFFFIDYTVDSTSISAFSFILFFFAYCTNPTSCSFNVYKMSLIYRYYLEFIMQLRREKLRSYKRFVWQYV